MSLGTASENPEHHANERTLPPRPASVCQFCWEGPFAAYLGVITHITSRPHEQSPGALSSLKMVLPYKYTILGDTLGYQASLGCQWCQFILTMCGGGPARDLYRITLGGGSVQPRTVTNLRISPDKTQESWIIVNEEARFTGYVYAVADDPAAAHIIARNPILQVRSPRAFALARQCIEECAREHPRCRAILAPFDEDPFLPTRLVHCGDPDHPRLVPTDGARGKYLALSYVWGGAQPHSTTLLNISRYERGIPAACLLATIRDAIYVTHALGIDYLWADALCIIQDSDEDKRRELGRMHNIYRDAYLTIIAANARRATEGFLHDRPAVSRTKSGAFPFEISLPFICPPRPQPAPVDHAGHSPTLQQVGTVHLVPTYDHIQNRAVEQYSHSSEPISRRGWCMQEYMMSPRSLIFTSETLQYRCQTATQNVGKSFYDPSGERRLHDALFLRDPQLPKPGSYEWHEVHVAWLRLVEDYTRRSVTVPSDKLVACGAIAEAFQRVLRSDYVAGLWRETLPCDLLWLKASEAGPGLTRPAQYRAPSWSWAAVDGGIAMPRNEPDPPPDYYPAVVVIRCEAILEDARVPFGQVTGGSLAIRGVLLPCMLNASPRGGRGNREISLSSLRHPSRWTEPDHRNGGGESQEADATPVGWACIDADLDLEVRTAWAIPLERGSWAVQGLVIAPTTDLGESDSERRTFRRLGFFHIKGRDDGGLRQALQNKELPMVEVMLV
ncbi:HET-domain-containing protein [Trametes cingulata]|nr:HET-domain-containing protein [Trametes cingulata]